MEINVNSITHIPIENLQRGEFQPRHHFDKTALEELADSIKSLGLIQPITVRPIGKERYEIVAGERRWRACQLAGLKTVPCIIYQYNDEEAARAATIENLQRQDLNPVEEAKAYQRLIDEFHYTHEKIAETLGKSRTKVSNSLRLLTLDHRVQKLLMEGVLSEGHGKVLLSAPLSLQVKIAEKCAIQAWSVRKLEQEIKKAQEKNQVANKDPNMTRLENLVTAQLAAEVKFEAEETGSGWMKIRYYDLETLEGIFQKMGVKQEE